MSKQYANLHPAARRPSIQYGDSLTSNQHRLPSAFIRGTTLPARPFVFFVCFVVQIPRPGEPASNIKITIRTQLPLMLQKEKPQLPKKNKTGREELFKSVVSNYETQLASAFGPFGIAPAGLRSREPGGASGHVRAKVVGFEIQRLRRFRRRRRHHRAGQSFVAPLCQSLHHPRTCPEVVEWTMF